MKQIYTLVVVFLLFAYFANAQTLIANYPLTSNSADQTGNFGNILYGSNATPPPSAACANGVYTPSGQGSSTYANGFGSFGVPSIASLLNTSNFQLDLDFQANVIQTMPILMLGPSYRTIGPYIYYDGTVGFNYNNNTPVQSASKIIIGTKYHISLKYVGQGYEMLLNSVPILYGTLPSALAFAPSNNDDTRFVAADGSVGLVFNGCINNIKIYSGGVVLDNFPAQDSLRLVALYNSTNGSAWTTKTNWLASGKPISTWYGITVNGSGRVTSINLPNNNLTGTIPDADSIGTLTNLQTLNLPNNSITGNLPATLGNLANLQTLNFGSNRLSGIIPPSFGNLTNLTSLTLNFNTLSGGIPSSLGNLSKLTVLDMWVNQFSGSIPAEIGNLTNLTTVWLNYNQLSGSIPTSFGNLTKLKELHLDNNLLSGTLPTQLTSFTQLTGLTLGTNQFTFDGLEAIVQKYAFTTYTPQATIPIAISTNLLTVAAGGTLAKNTYKWYQNGALVATNVGNANYVPTVSGTYYATVTNSIATALTLTSATKTVTLLTPTNISDSLALVDLYNNTNGSSWTNKTNWLVAGKPVNSWYGIGVSAIGRVTSINLTANNLNGDLPSSLGNLTSLTLFDLDGNPLTGTIPSSLGNLVNLTVFTMSGWGVSHIKGTIPSSMGNLVNLEELWLDGDNLSGPVPASLTNLTKLDSYGIQLQANNLTFDGLETIASKLSSVTYTPQANINIHFTNPILSVSAGGTLANNTYKWYQDGILVDSVKGDSTYMPNSNGNYSVQVTNSIATKLVLYGNLLAVNTVNFVLATTNTASTEAINGQTLFYNGTSIINTIIPSGASPVTGNITAKVTFDATVQSVNGQPYLQRHYDIEPATNASTATATVTLYYTQAEFTTYNMAAAIAGLPLLPIDATDADNNKANLRVIQFHGTGTAPGNYSGYTGVGATNILITPTTVSYNNNAARWEVTFPVTGFSGFYVSTGGNTLPITLISFTAILQNKQSILSWTTATETNNKGFDIERSADALTFTKIGYITGHGTTTQQEIYNYKDAQPLQGKNYYRLKQIDFDAHSTYSNIVAVNNVSDNNSLKVFPSPAKNNITISTIGYSGIVQILDMAGRIIKTTIISGNNTTLDITDLPAGNYFCKAGLTTILFVKQ